jgi:hypothetical protein
LKELGIDEQQISHELEEEGASKFSDSIQKMIKALQTKEVAIHGSR